MKKNSQTSFFSLEPFKTEFSVCYDSLKNNKNTLSLVHKGAKNKKGSLSITKVLLVDDDELNTFIVDNILKRQNIALTSVTNGVKAIELLKKETFDLILMDIQMPIMNGIDATNVIRNELKMQTPIIALTANSLEHQKCQVMEIGMNDFLTKPFKEKELISLISKHHYNFLTNNYEKLISKKKSSKNKLLYDLKKLQEVSNGNDDFVKKMCTIFVNIVPTYLTQMNDLYNDGNIKGLKMLVHKMKPSIDYMLISSLKQILKDLEHINDSNYSLENFKFLVNTTNNILTEVVNQIKNNELT